MDITNVILKQLIIPSVNVIFNGKGPTKSNGDDTLKLANEFLTSQLLYISNRVTLLGYACDQMSMLLNPRETDLSPDIIDMDFWEKINTIETNANATRSRRSINLKATAAMKEG